MVTNTAARLLGLCKLAAKVPFQNALDQTEYDPEDSEFIYGDDKHRWVVAPTTKHRYDINKLPNKLQDPLYQHLHLAGLLRSWREGKQLPYLTQKQNRRINDLSQQEAKYLHDRKRTIQLIIDSALSKNKTVKMPSIKANLHNLVYRPGED